MEHCTRHLHADVWFCLGSLIQPAQDLLIEGFHNKIRGIFFKNQNTWGHGVGSEGGEGGDLP